MPQASKSGYGEGELNGRSFPPLLKGTTKRHRDHVFFTNSFAAHHTYPMHCVRTEQCCYIQDYYLGLNFTTQSESINLQHVVVVDRAELRCDSETLPSDEPSSGARPIDIPFNEIPR